MKINFRELFNISNMLSLFRLLAAIPLFIFLGNISDGYHYRVIAVVLLLLTASTDFFDGYFARKLGQITELGKIIDPLADKICLGAIVLRLFLIGEISPFFFYIIITRDLLIFFGGLYVTKKIGKVLPSNMLGKITVTFISIFILAKLLMADVYAVWLNDILYYGSIALIVGSFIGYLIRAKETLDWYGNENIQKH